MLYHHMPDEWRYCKPTIIIGEYMVTERQSMHSQHCAYLLQDFFLSFVSFLYMCVFDEGI